MVDGAGIEGVYGVYVVDGAWYVVVGCWVAGARFCEQAATGTSRATTARTTRAFFTVDLRGVRAVREVEPTPAVTLVAECTSCWRGAPGLCE